MDETLSVNMVGGRSEQKNAVNILKTSTITMVFGSS